MGLPYIDIYTLTYHCDKETIERFLNEFTDRKAIEDQGDGELMMLPKGKIHQELKSPDDYVWIKAESVTNSINIGLSDPENCFTLYFISNIPDIDYALVSFTQDGKLILGLSVLAYRDDNGILDNYGFASKLMNHLQSDFDGVYSYFGLEAPPAVDEEAFLKEKVKWNGG